MTILYWFRRDLRLQDSEALYRAAKLAIDQSVKLVPIFVFEPEFVRLSPIRAHSLVASVKSLSQSIPGGLTIRQGDVPQQILESALSSKATRVIATRAHDTNSMKLQADVAELLFQNQIAFELVGSNYAVEPGRIRKADSTSLKVFTPFFNRWDQIPKLKPFELDASSVPWQSLGGELPVLSDPAPFDIKASEAFALRTWERFRSRALAEYSEGRNRTDRSGTSHLSHALAHGEIHPRTLLAKLGNSESEVTFRKELAWREFYADVLFNNPHTLTDYYEPRFSKMRYDTAEGNANLEAWKFGRTGFPIVDAAMRQLLTTGWMHNRARMIVASFLVKDLHIEWQVGAEWFERWLTDFDPASNAHGWQWTAGCGTDASPYFRVFNPTLQGLKFDPRGDYVRKFVPELRHLTGAEIHEPWKLIDGLSHGYPAPIVDHAAERDEALARLAELKLL